tara:strand:- start:4581 stop:4919 length:339 start_codon:yes stop_codon:yes gene_type:complete
MKENEFLVLLDKTDRDLDAFPFWSVFKKACNEYPVRGVQNLTPGRQALLILWEANSQSRDEKGKIISANLSTGNTQEKLERLKEDLIGHFMDDEIDDKALKKFIRSVVNRVA